MNPALFKNYFPENVMAYFTDTAMDFILRPEMNDFSVEQKNYIANILKLDYLKIFTMRQVHGKRVLNISQKDIPQRGDIPEADAMITNVPGIILSMRTADCLPVFLFDPVKKCIGLAHAGWKGSALNITGETVQEFIKNFGSQPSDIVAAFGPSIHECCYEVGEDFAKTFPAEVSLRQSKLCLDLPRVNKNQLLKAGVRSENIFKSQDCTVCAKSFYSFRRDVEKAGRHLSLMSIAR